MSAFGAAGQVGLLLVPVAVLGLVLVVVPVLVSVQRQWSAASAFLAVSAAAAGVAFVLVSAQRADANPGGGAEGALGTDVPGLLLPPLSFGVLALVTGRRRSRRARARG